jgi:hypothetical protein
MEGHMSDFDFNFNRMFAEAKGLPVYYNSKYICMSDKVPAKYGERFLVTIESTNSKYLQGVGISQNVEVFGEKNNRVVVYEYASLLPDQRKEKRSELPFSFEVICRNKKGYLSFYNMAQVDGRNDWFNLGCAMIVDELSNTRIYHCNDFQPNDDFNDIVFQVERLGT